MSTRDIAGTILINHWQRGVPAHRERAVTGSFVFFSIFAVIGLGIAAIRFFSPLDRFSAMNDAYAWGIWKTFNVMTLTALGSGPMAVGFAAWVLNREKLHVVMRTALASGFLFYATGLLSLGFDVGRAWNFYSLFLPWRWNLHSAMLEVAACMPLYAAIFLAFECLPMVLERFYYTRGAATRAWLRQFSPKVRKIYPYMLIGAYVLPLMHQSSLGALLMLAGDKINPLWQTPLLPLLYVIAAFVCGLGFAIFVLCIACLVYSRELDITVLEELGNLLSWTSILFLVLQFGDLAFRGMLSRAFSFDAMSIWLLLPAGLLVAAAIVLRNRAWRETPRQLLNMATCACVGGMLYRFVPATIAFHPAPDTRYFPSVPELLISFGYIALALVLFELAVKYFAVLPGNIDEWNHQFKGKRREVSSR